MQSHHFNRTQQQFLQSIAVLPTATVRAMFADIVAQRTPQIRQRLADSGQQAGNLAQMFNSTAARLTEQQEPLIAPTGYAERYAHLETTARTLFGSILACWTDFEIFTVLAQGQQALQTHQPANVVMPPQEQAEIVDDIAADTRFFTVDSAAFPLRLTHAVVLENLTQFVKGQQWYEMLDNLALSRQGRHFIYATTKKITTTLI